MPGSVWPSSPSSSWGSSHRFGYRNPCSQRRDETDPNDEPCCASSALTKRDKKGRHGAREAEMNRTGIVQHPTYLEHRMDPGHPERPERLKVIYEMLDQGRNDLPLIS